ncbi:SulP family inorganic anion transporter [Demequina lignilytica]|uniref:SulP family inorganic anion transporter n=1 Tax=Demequina lignilytica TaxID=3051663 RepID=A0AB35MF98_9MICO|nr:SulP family inorganic anion transporter [Demequina sp. SYSU T0a273]MDN4482438.1 SulP family inorganic anion transporter [Demequina sp. SYSU T0a273]
MSGGSVVAGVRGLLPGPADYAGLRRSWRGDLLAGVSVGVVALPLALGFGVTSGAGAEAGLITAIVAGLVAAVFGGSGIQVSGPTGAMVVVLAPILAKEGAGALALVTVMAGVIVIAAGALRLGRLVGLIPWPVIEGFTLGIALIILLQQVPAAVGSTEGAHGAKAWAAAFTAVVHADWSAAWRTLALVASVVVVMAVWPRVTRVVPGTIVAIVVATGAVMVLGWEVPVIGELPAGLPAPALPEASLGALEALAMPALAIAALAAIESLLSVRVAHARADVGGYDADRELVGQGLASIASGLVGGMPATGAIARTAVNVRSGARTRLAAVTHALVLLGVVVVASTAVARVPLAALAGVLMVTAITMVRPAVVRSVMRASRQDAVLFVVTALVTVSVDLIYAIAIGVAGAALFALRAVARAAGVHREELPGDAAHGDERIALLRLDGALFFGAADRVLERVARVHGVEVVILRMSQVRMLDTTGAQVLGEVVASLERRGVTVLVKGVQPRHLPLLEHTGALDALADTDHLVDDLDAAVAKARAVVSAG